MHTKLDECPQLLRDAVNKALDHAIGGKLLDVCNYASSIHLNRYVRYAIIGEYPMIRVITYYPPCDGFGDEFVTEAYLSVKSIDVAYRAMRQYNYPDT